MTRDNHLNFKLGPSLTYPLIVGIISVAVLLGWQFEIEALKRLLPEGVAMNPLTAILFGFCCLVLVLNFIYRRQVVLSLTLSALVFAVSAVKILSYLFHFEMGLDQVFFSGKLEMESLQGNKNEIAPNTAFNFMLLGLALLVYRSPLRNKLIADWLAVFVVFTSFLCLIGYLYNANEFYGISRYIPMAAPTAICFLLISFGILLNRQGSFMRSILKSSYSGGRMARHLLPLAVIIPVVLGLLRVFGEQGKIFTSNFGTAIFAAFTIMIFVAIILRVAYSINRSDEQLRNEIVERKKAEEQLRQSEEKVRLFNKELEGLVKERTEQLLHERVDKQVQITRAAIRGQEKEKKEIAMELHDNVNQILATVKLYLEMTQSFPEREKELIAKSRENINLAIQEIRKLSRTMLPPTAGAAGIIRSITDFAALIRQSSGLQVNISLPREIMEELDDSVQLSLYRIIQEQLNNVVKHAGASTVNLTLSKPGDLVVLELEDDGRGFDINANYQGIGLSNIRSRVEMLQGEFSLQSSPGQGCRMIISLPVNKIQSFT